MATLDAPAIRDEGLGNGLENRFPLLQWLGGSDGSDVFLTELSERGQKAIIKLIPADGQDAEARFAAWGAAAALSHPSLMRVFAFGRRNIESAAMLYVVTELAEEVLADVLAERALSPEEVAELLGPSVDALAYLHSKGLVHGRLKPSNIMAAGDCPKLSTDGLSFAGATVNPGPDPTVYIAPETAAKPIGPEADIWALGVTVVAALTQRPPAWDSLAPGDAVLPEAMPEPFASIARDCLRADPASRCTLEEIKSRLAEPVAPPRPVAEPETTPRTRRIAEGALLAAGILLTGLGIANAFFDKEKPVPPAAQQQTAPSVAVAPAPAAAPAAASTPASTRTPVAAVAPAPAQAPVRVARPIPQTTTPPAPGGEIRGGAVVRQVRPELNRGALDTIKGTVRVTVRLAVDENGAVTSAALELAGPSRYFAAKALEAAQQWRFRPAQTDGRAVPSKWTLDFGFSQSGVNVTPSETAP